MVAAVVDVRHRTNRAPRVNILDLPESLLGSGEFLRHSLQRHEEVSVRSYSIGNETANKQVEEMFSSSVDPGLVRTLCSEASSLEDAVQTLLVLSSTVSSALPADVEGSVSVHKGTPRSMGIDDNAEFPILVNGDGWQVLAQSSQRGSADIGVSWCQQAKAAARVSSVPGGAASHRLDANSSADAPARVDDTLQQAEGNDTLSQIAESVVLTDYDIRQNLGESHAKNFAQYHRSDRGCSRRIHQHSTRSVGNRDRGGAK